MKEIATWRLVVYVEFLYLKTLDWNWLIIHYTWGIACYQNAFYARLREPNFHEVLQKS